MENRKTSKRDTLFNAFVTTSLQLGILVATIPWHDSWFALIFEFYCGSSWFQPLQATHSHLE